MINNNIFSMTGQLHHSSDYFSLFFTRQYTCKYFHVGTIEIKILRGNFVYLISNTQGQNCFH